MFYKVYLALCSQRPSEPSIGRIGFPAGRIQREVSSEIGGNAPGERCGTETTV